MACQKKDDLMDVAVWYALRWFVPLTMALRVGFECFEDTQWIGTLLGSNESPEKSGVPS